jgi:hypothetical protein
MAVPYADSDGLGIPLTMSESRLNSKLNPKLL